MLPGSFCYFVMTTCMKFHPRHHPPPGLAFGEPDDRLQRVIQYSREVDDNREAAAYWIPAFAGMTCMVGARANAAHRVLPDGQITRQTRSVFLPCPALPEKIF
jgi:hypothetical protein